MRFRYKERYYIVGKSAYLVAICIWADQFTAKKLLINTDNIALLDILNMKSSKSQRVMSLVRPVVFLCMKKKNPLRLKLVVFKVTKIPLQIQFLDFS